MNKVFITNYMEQGPSWEVNSQLTSQEIPCHFYGTKGSLLCSQEPATGPYPKPDASFAGNENYSMMSFNWSIVVHEQGLMLAYLFWVFITLETLHRSQNERFIITTNCSEIK